MSVIPETAIIQSVKAGYPSSRTICGLYPLERNIMVLSRAGVKKIHLDLSVNERDFFQKKVKRHLKRLEDTEVNLEPPRELSGCLLVPSNLFLQAHHLQKLEEYFTLRDEAYHPLINSAQFLLNAKADFAKGTFLAREQIRQAGGYLARNLNKRISLPVSLLLARTRIHPNILTVINMAVGIMSAVFLLFNEYGYIVLGGFLFQLASILDGVDGEVAKFTFKVSKIGGWLDTISDNSTLVFFLAASSYLFFLHVPGYLSMVIIGIMFAGLAAMLMVMIRFLHRCSHSGSLVTYDKEFLQKLPPGDSLAVFIQRLKYITKKEFFALFFFLVSLTGWIYLVIPFISAVLLAGAVILAILDIRYLKTFSRKT